MYSILWFLGSQTLHHWQRLATPHLGGIFEQRSGVRIKSETKLKELDEKVSLSDFEEDEGMSWNIIHYVSGTFVERETKNLELLSLSCLLNI